jgi:hypothetical protein
MSIVFLRFGSELDAGSGDSEHAEQVRVADVSLAAVNHHPEMRCEVAMEGAVSLQPMDHGVERFGAPRITGSLLEEILQLRDFSLISRRHILKL